MKTKTPKARQARNGNGGSRCVQRMVRHPAAVALDKWLESDEGKGCTEPTTLNAPAMQRHYLENRLKRAFNAGWCAAERMPNDKLSHGGDNEQ